MPGREGFDDLDTASHGLVELPERGAQGFVWAMRDPDAVINLDSHLGPLDAELAAWGYDYAVAGTLELELGSNWKCALEAFQETYHFPYVHGDSIAQGVISNIVTFDQFGRHHRLGVPLTTIGTDPEPPEGEHLSCIYYIYPCSVIATSPLGGELLQFYPGPSPSSSTIRHTVLSRLPLSDQEVAAFFEEYTPVIQGIIRDEDGPVLERSGKGLAAGRTDVVLGRNEIGCQAAHLQIQADLAGDRAPCARVPCARPSGSPDRTSWFLRHMAVALSAGSPSTDRTAIAQLQMHGQDIPWLLSACQHRELIDEVMFNVSTGANHGPIWL